MAGTKNTKASFKAMGASGGQLNLFHFYKKTAMPQTDVTTSPEVGNAGSVPSRPSGTSDPPTSSPKDEIAAPPSTTLETQTKQRQCPEGALVPSSFVDEDGKNDVQESDDNPSGGCSRPPFRLASVPLPQTAVAGGSDLLPRVQAAVASPPLHRGLFPIFKHSFLPPSSPPSALGSSRRPVRQRIQLSKRTSPESPQNPEIHTHSPHADHHNVVDLTESPRRDTSDKAIQPARTSIIVIDDEPDPRGSRDEPIDISSSPLPKIQTKVIHPFFALRPVAQEGQNHKGIPLQSISNPLQLHLPWPDAEAQHTQGPQNCFLSSISPFPAYRRCPQHKRFSSQPSIQFLENQATTRLLPEDRLCALKPHMPTPHERKDIISNLPDSHRVHPGISRLLDVNVQLTSGNENEEMWTRKWRPRNIAEILGNEDNVRYIKEWLQALEIQTSVANSPLKDKDAGPMTARGVKRPVVRVVEKKRRKKRKVESDDESSVGSWIVQDGEEEEVSMREDFTKDELLPRSSLLVETVSKPPSTRQVAEDPADRHTLAEFTHLTNTIILTGPPGSGKTSAVYACVEELGWEIFEVYPGIGKRSGSNISSLVGDVGKNHIVGRRGAAGKGAKSTSNSIFGSGFGYLAETRVVPIGTDDGSVAVRQSIILLEEADILFKEDANFWPTVVNIIKASHRPVLMTCNDVSLIPQEDLPVQATLIFKSCPPPLAVSFLQSICLAEGLVVPREQLDDLYSTTYEPTRFDQPNEPQIPYPSQPQASPDLRRALNELQFWCRLTSTRDEYIEELSGPSLSIAPDMELLADWSRPPERLTGSLLEEDISLGNDISVLWKHSEDASYVDGNLARRLSDVLEASAIDRYEASVDDEIGYILLEKQRRIDSPNSLSCYSKDDIVAQDVLMRSRHVLESTGIGPRARVNLLGDKRGATLESRSLVRGRAANQTQVVTYLDDVIPLFAPLLPRPPTILEYAAYVRQMVEADDERMARGASGGGGQERRRRGWAYEEGRYLNLSEEGLEAARKTRLTV